MGLIIIIIIIFFTTWGIYKKFKNQKINIIIIIIYDNIMYAPYF